MKKILFILLGVMLIAQLANAQRYAIVDTRYILDKMPEYKEAQKNWTSSVWDGRKKLMTEQAVLDKMYKDFDAEQVMLSDELKKKREDELFIRERN